MSTLNQASPAASAQDLADLRTENERLRRRLASTETRERERQGQRLYRLESVADANGLAVFDWIDTSRDEVFFTPAAYGVLGHPAYSFVPSWKALLERIHPIDRTGFTSGVRRAIYERSTFATEIRVRRADGAYHYIEFSGKAIATEGDTVASRFTGALRDIEDQHRAHGEVALLKERLALVIKGARAGVWDWPNMAKEEVYWSKGLYELLGYDPARYTMTLPIFWSLIHDADVPRVRAELEKSQTEGSDFEVEYRLRFRQRGYRWIRSAGAVVCDSSGEARRLTGAIFDIHDLVPPQGHDILKADTTKLKVYPAGVPHRNIKAPARRRKQLSRELA